jgi:hypothetical protein
MLLLSPAIFKRHLGACRKEQSSAAAAVGCLGVTCRLLDLIEADCRSMRGGCFSASRMSVREIYQCLLQARLLLRCCDCWVVDQNQVGSHLGRLVEAECRYARKGSNPNITRVSDAYSNEGCKLCVCSFAAAVRRLSKTRQLSFWASDRGGMPIDCRREQSITPRSRVSDRRTSVPVLRSAAVALKHCR